MRYIELCQGEIHPQIIHVGARLRIVIDSLGHAAAAYEFVLNALFTVEELPGKLPRKESNKS